MTEYTKTIKIRSYNLGAEASTPFILTFDSDDIPGIFKTVFPTAWTVTGFGKAGAYEFTATFKSQLSFMKTQIQSSIVGPASTYIPINAGQETILTKEANVYMFSEPTPFSERDEIVAKNETKTKVDLGLGFFAGKVENPPTTILLYKGVNSGSSVQIKFQPILRGYVISGIQENEVLTTKLDYPVLFSEDITQLDDETIWRITYDKVLDEYKIERDD